MRIRTSAGRGAGGWRRAKTGGYVCHMCTAHAPGAGSARRAQNVVVCNTYAVSIQTDRRAAIRGPHESVAVKSCGSCPPTHMYAEIQPGPSAAPDS